MSVEFHSDYPAGGATWIRSNDVTSVSPVALNLAQNRWQLVTNSIKSSDIPSNAVWVRIWIGKTPEDAECDFYVDDIRFHPSDALVTTTYYHPLWRQPVCTVDPNNQPSRFITYDNFGRPNGWYKIDRTRSRVPQASYDYLVMKKEYHLMGESQ